MSKTKNILESRLANKMIPKEETRNLKGGSLESNAEQYGLISDYYADNNALEAAISVMRLEQKLCKKANNLAAESNGDGIW